MSWRNAQAAMQLVAEINARWPRRDRASDGGIGDAAHATRTSDHNPWLKKGGLGIVRARDVDKDGVDAPWLVEHLRQLGARRDPRLWPNGYIIFNRRITSPDFSRWNAYNGSNPHTAHFHVSFSTDTSARGFDSTAGWGIHGVSNSAPAAPAPATKKGLPLMIDRPLVKGLQQGRIICPTGSASGIVAAAWVSVTITGGGRVEMWCQRGARSHGAPPGTANGTADWTIWNAERPWMVIPDGTEFIDYRVNANGDGAILIEQKAK